MTLKSNPNALTCYRIDALEDILELHVFDSVSEYTQFMREFGDFIPVSDVALKIHGEAEQDNDDSGDMD